MIERHDTPKPTATPKTHPADLPPALVSAHPATLPGPRAPAPRETRHAPAAAAVRPRPERARDSEYGCVDWFMYGESADESRADSKRSS